MIAFHVEVAEVARFRLIVLQDGVEVSRGEFDQNVVTIGRSQKADLRIPSNTCSRQQAELLRTGRGFAMFAHKTTNPTKVRGQAIPAEDSVSLDPGDPIRIADTFDMTFELLDTPASTESDEAPASKVTPPARDKTPRAPETSWVMTGCAQASS